MTFVTENDNKRRQNSNQKLVGIKKVRGQTIS